MASESHRFFCRHCQEFIRDDNPSLLASRVNLHNDTKHPADCSNWTSFGITLSANYAGPFINSSGDKLIERRAMSEKEWGDAATPPEITADDRAFLARGLVRW